MGCRRRVREICLNGSQMNIHDKIKVLSVAHSATTTSSGRARYEIISELHPEIDLQLVVPRRWREYGRETALNPPSKLPGLQVERVRLASLPTVNWYLHYYPALSDIVARHQPDVIHLWEEPWSLVALHAGWLRERLAPNAALVLETEQNILRRLPQPFEWIRQRTLQQADFDIGRQRECLDVIRACGFDGPSAVVEFCVDSTIFWPRDRSLARRELPATGLVIGYVGRIVQEKGLNDVLAAIHRCGCDISLWILGDGPDREQIIQRADQLGLGDRVQILEPRRPGDVALFMSALDALVLMSRTTRTWKEQFGRVIGEAHACGIPVIGSDSGAIPSVVADGGWIIHEGDVVALADLLRHLGANRAELDRAGAAGLAQARRRFSVENVAAKLAEAFVQAREAGSRRRAGSETPVRNLRRADRPFT
jgi:glycosyltransferase involved in cell wall biosynthesis